MKRFSLILGLAAALVLTSCATSVTNGGDGIVHTKYGALQGGVSNGIYTYFGVPYAEADERFVPAGKVKPWSGVRNAAEYGSISLQSSVSGFPAPKGNMDNNS